MCGRYANAETIPAMAARFRAEVSASSEGITTWGPSWNIAPTQRHPVVIQDRHSRRIGLMRWGWQPTFMAGKTLTLYFVNHRPELSEGVGLWIHGHTHASCDYIIPETGCRVVCNPHGYQRENGEYFDPALVVEV